MSQWKPARRSQSPRSRNGSNAQPQLAHWSLKAVDFALAGVIFAGPHLFGGRHLLGRFVILSLCVTAALACSVRQFMLDKPTWTRTPLVIVLAAIAWVAFQLVPLPPEWLDFLAPHHAELLPLWNGSNAGVSLGDWRTLSFSPEDTRLALATLIAYGLLFITAVQRMETFEDVQRITRWIAVSAVVVAGFGMLQFFTANGKYFWFYEHPYAVTAGELKAGFTSRNHCAHFLVLGLANLFAWMMLARNREHTAAHSSAKNNAFRRRDPFTHNAATGIALTAAAMMLIFATLATLSRGGTLAMVAAVGVSAAIYGRARLLNSNYLLGGTSLILLMLGMLSFSGNYDKLAERMDSLTSTSLEDLDHGGGRRNIWAANVDAFNTSRLTGWGGGTHRFVYPIFIGEPTTKEFTHAENGYLQVATEHGLVGLVILAAIVMSTAWWCVRIIIVARDDRAMQIIAGGVAGALAASIVHSIVDFVWFIPACMSVTVLLVACIIRLSQLATDTAGRPAHQIAFTPLARFNLTLATSLAGLWIIQVTYPAAATSLKWDTYLRADRARQSAYASQFSTVENEDGDGSDSVDLNSIVVQESLLAVVRDYPNSARAHLRLASYLLARFEELQQRSDNAMNISQIREAADASQFASPQTLHDWLKQAFGDNCMLLYSARAHALAALRLCPLEGQAYLYLAELAFLEGRGPAGYAAYAEQALRVRPVDADVLFAVGKNELVAGDVDSALRHWSQAYRGPGNHQQHIIQILAGRMSAVNFLDVFAPDWRTLGLLWESYKQAGSTADLKAILPYARTLAKKDTSKVRPALAGKYWHDLARMQLEMEDPQGALESLQHAYAAFPESVNTRRLLGRCLMRFEQFEFAESHLRWCAQQSPESKAIRAELLQATRGKMQQLARTTHSSTK